MFQAQQSTEGRQVCEGRREEPVPLPSPWQEAPLCPWEPSQHGLALSKLW